MGYSVSGALSPVFSRKLQWNILRPVIENYKMGNRNFHRFGRFQLQEIIHIPQLALRCHSHPETGHRKKPDVSRHGLCIFSVIPNIIIKDKAAGFDKSHWLLNGSVLDFVLVIRFQILVRTETGGGPAGPPFFIQKTWRGDIIVKNVYYIRPAAW